MAKLTRYTQQTFGTSAGANQISKFGSLAAASPQRFSGSTITPAIVQALSNYLEGWFSSVEGVFSPAIEDMNAICYLFGYQLTYLMQEGIPEYDAETIYYQYSICQLNGTIYQAIFTSGSGFSGQTPPNVTYWQEMISNQFTTLGDIIYSAANAVPTRLAGNTSSTKKFLTQTGTGSVSAAPQWSSLLTTTVTTLKSTGTTVGYVVTISSGSATAGATYTYNGNTYTVIGTVSSATQIFFSGTSNPSDPTTTGTFTKSSGTGDVTLSFTGTFFNLAWATIAQYVVPTPSPVQLYIKSVGGGGGGMGGNESPNNAGNGGNTLLLDSNANLILSAGGGQGGASNILTSTGGTNIINSPAIEVLNLQGAPGGPTAYTGAGFYVLGGTGGSSALGGAGPGLINNSGIAASPNTGSGGGGGASGPATALYSGGGGSSGGYIEAIIPNPIAGSSYYYSIGAAGLGIAGGVSSFYGANGGSGLIAIQECNQ